MGIEYEPSLSFNFFRLPLLRPRQAVVWGQVF